MRRRPFLTITAAGSDVHTGTAAVTGFDNLTGTINFGGKSFDLGSVDYDKSADTSNNGITDGTESLAALNKAAKAALGLTTDPFASGSSTTITFSVQDAVAGYTTGRCAAGDPAGHRADGAPELGRHPDVHRGQRCDGGDRPAGQGHQDGLDPARRPGCHPEPVRSPSTTSTSRWRT